MAWQKNRLGQTTIGFSEGLIGLVGQREEPLNLVDARQHPHFKYAPEVKEDDFNAFLGTPIIHQGQVLGVISIQQKQARHFTEMEESFLVTLSAQLAASLANAKNRGWSGQVLIVSNKRVKALYSRCCGIARCSNRADLCLSQPKADLSTVKLLKVADSETQKSAF